jgi:hypothetical protein
MLTTIRSATLAAVTCVALIAGTALADDHPYTEGPVVNMQAVRTEYGKFDDYMSYLNSTWKQEQEAGKKAGYILSYKVLQVEPRAENDPDLYLVVTFKNWAALDGALAKADAIFKQVLGSVAASNQGAVDRSKIRRVLGSTTMQELELK